MDFITGIMLGAAGVFVYLAYRHGKLAGYVQHLKDIEQQAVSQLKLPASGGIVPRIEAAARRMEAAVGGKTPPPAQPASQPVSDGTLRA